jgi:type VI secretion system Hcp family effector
MSRIAVEITDIDGEETLTDYLDQITCSSMQHGIDLPVVATGTDRTDGASMHGSMVLEHAVDKASPALRMACAQSTNITDVKITRLSGADNHARDITTLKTCKIINVYLDTPLDAASGVPADMPSEFFVIDYEEIKWEHKTYVDGVLGDTISGTYDTTTMSTTVSIT